MKIGIHTSILVNGSIEDGVQISSYVAIVGKHDHAMNIVGQRPYNAPWIFDPDFPPRDERHSVVLERDCWVGWGAIILSGVRIGRGAVIAAGSVVNRDVAPYAIVAGNPARQVSVLFSPEQIEEHEDLLTREQR
ncbi:DapH/DapD/GlmU-related protein [Phenylobacterium sp.]|uniref:DapH/DapD/GlmU-related protein n=1 Tax=Phenylobacterium sp. TaxID=1871053 RepID=UPI0035AE1076